MNDSEELNYWHAFIEGDLDALAVLFLHYAKGLFSYGMKICLDEELLKDSIQEVFIQLIQKSHKLKQNDSFKGLVYRMLRNKMIDEIKLINRSKKNYILIFNTHPGFEINAQHLQIAIEKEVGRKSKLNSAFEQLSIHQKEGMLLKYSNGLSYEQISETMGISIASTRTLIYKTLKQLKLLISGKLEQRKCI